MSDTDSFGNIGEYKTRDTNEPCPTNDRSNCYFSVDIRAGPLTNFGAPTHTLEQERDTGIGRPRQSAFGGCQISVNETATNIYGEEYTITSKVDENISKSECLAGRGEWKEDYLRKGDEFDSETMEDILGNINNGRVGDINIFDTPQEAVIINDNQETGVKGIIDETALSQYFLSEQNTMALQKTLRYKVYQLTNEVVDNQSAEALYIVMRSILLQHGNFRIDSKDIVNEIQYLNSLVLDYCVKEVSSNVLQYKVYLNDVNSLPIPLDRPSFDDTGSRNRTYDLSNHIAPIDDSGWGFRHREE